MKVQELLMNIHNKEFNLEKSLQVKKYLPIETKKTIAQGILYDCTTEENGSFKIDSVQRYMSYVRYMITTHTNLEYTDENYDALCSTIYNNSTLLNAIMNCFETDATECSRILNLMTDDYMQERSIENAVHQFLYRLNNIIDKFSNVINDKVDSFDLKDLVADGYDSDIVKELLSKYIK